MKLDLISVGEFLKMIYFMHMGALSACATFILRRGHQIPL